MSNLLLTHPNQNIALINICLPASHDAAMYIPQHCTAFANEGNTQTQYLPMKQQLEAGLRLFDIRPSFYQNDFYTEHSTHCDGLGCKGDKVKNMFQATSEFLSTHPELVILSLSHFCHTSATDTALIALINNVLGDYLYKAVSSSDTPLIQQPLKQMVPAGNKTGKVVVLIEGADNTKENRAKGIFGTNELKTAGGWSNDNEYPNLLNHQLKRFAKYEGNGTALFELAWQITQHDAQAVRSAFSPHAPSGIVYGAQFANKQLPLVLDSLIKNGSIHKGKIPNIIWSDFADTMVAHQCMRLSDINLR